MVTDITSILNLLSNVNASNNVAPWQNNLFGNAQIVDVATSGGGGNLYDYARVMTPVVNCENLEKTCFFGFSPSSDRQWNVYAVDKFRNIIALIGNYKGTALNRCNNQQLRSTFLLRIV